MKETLEQIKHDAAFAALRTSKFRDSLSAIFKDLVKDLPYDYDILYVTDKDMHIDIDMQIRPKTEDQKESFPYDEESNCLSAIAELCFDWNFEQIEIYADDTIEYVKGQEFEPVGIITVNDFVSYTCGLDLSEEKTKEIESIFKEMFIRTVKGRI